MCIYIYFHLEYKFPSSQGRWNAIEDALIAVLPNSLAGNNHDLSKNFGVECMPCCYNHVTSGKAQVPIDLQKYPAPLAERTLKEQVKRGLLRSIWAYNTVVALQISSLPSQ